MFKGTRTCPKIYSSFYDYWCMEQKKEAQKEGILSQLALRRNFEWTNCSPSLNFINSQEENSNSRLKLSIESPILFKGMEIRNGKRENRGATKKRVKEKEKEKAKKNKKHQKRRINKKK